MLKEYSASAGTALPDTAAAAPDAFAHLALKAITTSLTNPRKHFNPTRLAELTESIRASGVHQPILVRPLPGHRVADTTRDITHEIVSGERRYRASLDAGLANIPAMIRDLSDDQVLAIQLVENLQRDDLTELEEAEGYQALMAATQLTADLVGGKIGKSRSYVYARLKLLDLSQECKQAMRDGHIDATRALQIARIPDTALQTKALAESQRKDYHGEPYYSTRAFALWLQQNVMLKLENATFKITDARLVEAAGSCKDCPKRTGASPDLFADVAGTDICTDPACYHTKTEAHQAALRAKADAKGMRIIEGAEAKEICRRYGSYLEGYSRLSEQRDDAKEPATLGKLLGKDAPAPVLIENPWTKELVEAVPTDEAEGILLAKGLIKATEAQADKERAAKNLEWQINALKSKAESAINKQTKISQYEALRTAVRAMPDKAVASLLTPALLRAWLISRLDDYDNDEAIAQACCIELPEDCTDGDEYMRLHLQAAPSAQLYRAAALWMVSDDIFSMNNTLFSALAEPLSVDLDALHAQAAKKVKAETAAELAALKKQLKAATPAATPDAEPAPAATAPAAPAKASPKASARKGKMTPEEALSGIAGAMQNIEMPVGFVTGQRVRITTDTDKLGTFGKKWAGKEGTVTKRDPSGSHWDVTFKGRNGGVQMFAEDQMEALAA